MTAEPSSRKRRFRISVRTVILIVAAVGIGFGAMRRFGPLTPDEAARIARAEVVRRDPEFASKSQIFEVSADELNAGRRWNWAYQWEVIMKRNGASTGYVVKVNGRGNIKVGRAYDISDDHCYWENPQ